MNLWPRHERSSTLAAAFAGGAALLCASLVNLLHHNEYPLLRPEVGLIVAAILALCGAMAVFYGEQRQWGRSFLEGFLAVLFVDLNTDSLLLAFAVGAAIGLATWFWRVSLLGPMAIIGLVVLGTTIVGIGGNPHWIKVEKGGAPGKGKPAAADKPAIVHLILDEHIGIEGLPDDVEGRRLRGELRRFYLANGFAVYGGAYSQHYETVNAIPAMLNFGKPSDQTGSKSGIRTGPTTHLQSLAEQGYRLTIFQSDYVDYCVGARFDECVTYDSSSLRPTLAVPMEISERMVLIASKFLALSDISTAASRSWNLGAEKLRRKGIPVPRYETHAGQSSTVGTLEAMGELNDRIRLAGPGEAIFAHLLLPHFPFVLDSECRYLPRTRWEGRYFGSTINSRNSGYGDQVRCTIRQVEAVLGSLSRSPAGADPIVIIHGDHGSRIVRVGPFSDNFGRIGDADMIAAFSTLFAVRASGVKPGYHPDRQPIVPLLLEFAVAGFQAAPQPKPPARHTVYLSNSDWKPVRVAPLPESWTKGSGSPVEAH